MISPTNEYLKKSDLEKKFECGNPGLPQNVALPDRIGFYSTRHCKIGELYFNSNPPVIVIWHEDFKKYAKRFEEKLYATVAMRG